MCVLFVKIVATASYDSGDVIQVFEDGYDFGGRSDASFEPANKVIRLTGEPIAYYKRLEEVYEMPFIDYSSKAMLVSNPLLILLQQENFKEKISIKKAKRRYSYLNSIIIDKGAINAV